MKIRASSTAIRFYGIALVATTALLTAVWPGSERFYCRGERVSFEVLAGRRSVSASDVDALRALGFTTQTLCDAPNEVLQKGIRAARRGSAGRQEADHPGEAVAWRNLSLRDENGEIAPDGLMRAKAQADLMRSQDPDGTRTAGIMRGHWTSIGPGNIGGRIRAIVIRPSDANTMFIGSVSGGIWKTINGGTSWTPVDDFMANLAVTSMVMDPSNENVMYAGTGEGFFGVDAIRGAGLFKSTDGGTTWVQLPSTSTAPGAGMNASDFFWVNRVAMTHTGSVLALATRSGIFHSSDGGASFTRATMVGGGEIDHGSGIMDLRFNPADASKAVAGTLVGSVLHSADGGSTWSSATGLPGGEARVEVAYAPSSPNTVYASVDRDKGSLYKSTNGGASFTEVFDGASDTTIDPLSDQGWYDNMLFVSPTNANFVVWGGIDLWRSTNGGVTFHQMSEWFSQSYTGATSAHSDQHIAIPHPGFNGTSNQTVFFGNDGGIYKAANVSTVGGGASPFQTGWEELNNNLAITQFYGGAGHAATGRITAGAQDNGQSLYDPALANPSENWASVAAGDGGYSAYDPTSPNQFYGEYVTMAVQRSLNGVDMEYINGLYWNGSNYVCKAAPYRIGDGVTDGCDPEENGIGANFIAPLILDPGNPNRLLAGGLRLWRTNDATTANTATTGPSWAHIKDSTKVNISAIAVAPGASHVIWVGHNNGSVYRTINGLVASPTWVERDTTAPHLPSRMATRITIDPSNSNTVYVTFGGFSGDNVWRTVDGGDNWTDITGSGVTGLPNAPVRDLEIHPSHANWLYAATEVGIFASTDGGATWGVPHDGPSNVPVDELFFLGTKLHAVTHGRGIYSVETVSPPFTDDPLTAMTSVIRAVHILELRARINDLRSLRGLGAYSWTHHTLTLGSTIVRAVDVTELRTALIQAYNAAPAVTPPVFTDTLVAGTTIKALHIAELRAAVIALEGS